MDQLSLPESSFCTALRCPNLPILGLCHVEKHTKKNWARAFYGEALVESPTFASLEKK